MGFRHTVINVAPQLQLRAADIYIYIHIYIHIVVSNVAPQIVYAPSTLLHKKLMGLCAATQQTAFMIDR